MSNALYIAYFSGAVGQSIGLFYIGSGVIAGVDVGGMTYDGGYKIAEDGSLEGIVEYNVPPGTALITGMTGGATPVKIPVKLRLPADFANGQVLTIPTPTGAVNARFEKMKDLP